LLLEVGDVDRRARLEPGGLGAARWAVRGHRERSKGRGGSTAGGGDFPFGFVDDVGVEAHLEDPTLKPNPPESE
jgi:hypothetical protein